MTDITRVNTVLSKMRAATSGQYSLIEVAQAASIILAECIGMATDDQALAIEVAVRNGEGVAAKIVAEWPRLQAQRNAVRATGRPMQ